MAKKTSKRSPSRRRSGRASATERPGRKAAQLCAQIARTLNDSFAGMDDDLLRDLTVVSASPAPDDSNVLVTLRFIPGCEPPELAPVLDRLAKAASRLREDVASAITRKRVPNLIYVFDRSLSIDPAADRVS